MAINSNITQDKHFPAILDWIDQVRYEGLLRLIASLFGAVGWTLAMSLIIAFGIVFFESLNTKQSIIGTFQPGSLLFKTFFIVLGCNLFLGFIAYFTLRNRIVEEIDKGEFYEIMTPQLSQNFATLLQGMVLLDVLISGYGLRYIDSDWFWNWRWQRGWNWNFRVFDKPTPIYCASPIAMFGQLMFLTGPGIFVNAINEKEHLLKLGDESARRHAAIVILTLFRLCGEPIDIENFELEVLTWGQRMIFFAKLEKIGWIHLTDQFQKANLNSDIEKELVAWTGYKR